MDTKIQLAQPTVLSLVEVAKQLSLPELFQLVQALLELLQERFLKVTPADGNITQRLNQVYSTDTAPLDAAWAMTQAQAIGVEPW